MDDCCSVPDPDRYDAVFGPRFARDVASRYSRKGLTRTERRMVDFLAQRGIDGASVLEIGGGVGEIQLELLARGASHTVNLELSSAYESQATQLIAGANVRDRVRRIVGVDLAREPEAVDRADLVVLHRVVCCYPDYEGLLSAAADRAVRAVVFSHPPRSWLTRWGVAAQNLMLRLSRRSYRGFVHPPDAMVDVLRRHGLEPALRSRSWGWCVVGAVRQ